MDIDKAVLAFYVYSFQFKKLCPDKNYGVYLISLLQNQSSEQITQEAAVMVLFNSKPFNSVQKRAMARVTTTKTTFIFSPHKQLPMINCISKYKY